MLLKFCNKTWHSNVFHFRCFYIAQSYLAVKKWKETLALYERALDYCRQAIDKYAKSQLEPVKKAKVRTD